MYTHISDIGEIIYAQFRSRTAQYEQMYTQLSKFSDVASVLGTAVWPDTLRGGSRGSREF